jgi:hypothetical protein
MSTDTSGYIVHALIMTDVTCKEKKESALRSRQNVPHRRSEMEE